MKKILSLVIALVAVLIFATSCDKDPVEPVRLNKVLILYDDTTTNVNTVSLKAAIETAGYEVVFSVGNESKWNNKNPSLDGVLAVIHLNGTSYDYEMPLAGQEALVDFVKNKGGYYVQAEWDGYQVDSENEMLAMTDLVLLQRGNAASGEITVEMVTAQASHAVMKNIPSSFVMTGTDVNGTARVFTESPSVVLMTEGTRDAVVVREFGTGKVLGFHHSGNYEGDTHWADTNIQKIVVNFLNWE